MLHDIIAGLVGLAISYALSITNLLNGAVTYFTETEKQMVSVERASQYINDVPAEKQTSTLNVHCNVLVSATATKNNTARISWNQ